MANDTMANTMSNRSNGNPGGDKSRSNPVGANTVGGARVVSNSSDGGSESLGLGDSPVLALQRLVHRLVGHLASANSNSRCDSNSRGNSNSRGDSSVGNTSNESMASNTSNRTVGSNTMGSNASNETGTSNKASHCTVASEELGSGGGSCHKGGDTEGGLHSVEGFDGIPC